MLDLGAGGGSSFDISTTQRHCPSASSRQIAIPLKCKVIGVPFGPGTVISSSVPAMYASLPSGENVTLLDFQWILKTGLLKHDTTYRGSPLSLQLSVALGK